MLQSGLLMIRSMTGYGQGAAEIPGLKVTVELRSVNNRYVDLKLRLPDELIPFEQELRRKVLATVRRGRVDLDLRLAREGASAVPLALDRSVVEAALAAWKTLRDEYGIAGTWTLEALMRVPGIFDTEAAAAPLDGPARAAIDGAVDAALAALDAERAREGARLRDDLVARAARMSATVDEISRLAASVPSSLARRITERVEQLAAQVALDPARVAQEAAFLAERSDVTEEIVRLQGHLSHARSLLTEPGGEPVGKRLEFLLQEIHRETNTVASKAADLAISRLALELKAEAEKVREQIQNLE
jgi:uncharacterized protein (TIGR00255 family)